MARVVACALTVLAIAGAVGGAAAAPETADLAVYPQAGILWRDLYVNNFVALDPG